MNEFGNLLRYYRRNCTDPERGGQLTQDRLGEFIGRHLGDLTAQTIAFDLPVAMTTTSNGIYFHINGEIEVVAGMPILPRTSVDITLPDEIARGAFFESGSYQTYAGFDPVVSRLVTETTTSLMEPPYLFDVWAPAVWDLVNSVQTPEGLQQRLVIVPAQYRATTSNTGTLQVFDTMAYTVFYADSRDTLPPDIRQVSDALAGNTRLITAKISDLSGVARAAVAYTTGNGQWHVVAMSVTSDAETFTANLPEAPTLIYFVQALDHAANVVVADYKAYYNGPGGGPPPEPVTEFKIYLPLINKSP